MINLVKQLLTSRAYWAFHDFMIKFWWAGAVLLLIFWLGIFTLRGTDSIDSKKFFFSGLEASETSDKAVDLDTGGEFNKEKKTESDNEQESAEKNIKVDEKVKREIDLALEDLNKKYPSRKYVFWKTIKCKLTAYTPDARSCGNWADGFTSKMDNAYRFDGVAASPDVIPYRTGVYIPGVGIKEVDDTGGAMRQAAKKGFYHIDIRFKSNEEAEKFGVKWQNIHLFKVAG